MSGNVPDFGPVVSVVRLDAAGQYAENLLHFLQALGRPTAGATGGPALIALTLSCGDPQRNKNYRAFGALSGALSAFGELSGELSGYSSIATRFEECPRMFEY